MPARPPHVRLCGDLETACTDVLLYLAAYSELNGSGPGHSTVGLRGFKLNPALLGYGQWTAARTARRRGRGENVG